MVNKKPEYQRKQNNNFGRPMQSAPAQGSSTQGAPTQGGITHGGATQSGSRQSQQDKAREKNNESPRENRETKDVKENKETRGPNNRDNREKKEVRDSHEKREGNPHLQKSGEAYQSGHPQQYKNNQREVVQNRPPQSNTSNYQRNRSYSKVRTEETMEDITADINRIEKEIELEIREIRSLHL